MPKKVATTSLIQVKRNRRRFPNDFMFQLTAEEAESLRSQICDLENRTRAASQVPPARLLNHVERSITAVYDRHSYDPEKRAALDWWDIKLQGILDNKDSAKVLLFAR